MIDFRRDFLEILRPQADRDVVKNEELRMKNDD